MSAVPQEPPSIVFTAPSNSGCGHQARESVGFGSHTERILRGLDTGKSHSSRKPLTAATNLLLNEFDGARSLALTR